MSHLQYPLLVFLFVYTAACQPPQEASSNEVEVSETEQIVEKDSSYPIPAAYRLSEYLPELADKSVALVVNHSSMIGNRHLLDTLLSRGVEVKKVFAPEHGFRGKADAGKSIADGKDKQTGLPIVSLYGKHKKPTADDLNGIDMVVFDIQDVGARFYTYISTMHYAMEACAENGVSFMVLDRPNPNGHYVDGPVLEPAFESFVGMHPIPIVHGLTVGELAGMINGEGWLANELSCDLEVVKCSNYTHSSFYELPIEPSPNLPNMRAVYLYPSLCLFEGTNISVGRGTDYPFQVLGHPKFSVGSYVFIPEARPGATNPKWKGRECYGSNYSSIPLEYAREQGFQISYLLNYYNDFKNKEDFFIDNNFFEKLAGTGQLRKQVKQGLSEGEIRVSWQPELDEFKMLRKKYLLYAE